MSEYFIHFNERTRRSFEEHLGRLREKAENLRLLNGAISNARAIDLQRASLSQDAFMGHVQNSPITSITVIAVRREETRQYTRDYNFAGPISSSVEHETREVHSVYSLSFAKEELTGVYVEDLMGMMEKHAEELHEPLAHERAENFRRVLPHLSVRLTKQDGGFINEDELRSKKEKAKRFRERVSNLPLAVAGMEYKELFGEPVLLPIKGSDVLVEGTRFTQKQIIAAREILFAKNAYPLSLFRSFLEKREKMLREGYPDIEDFIKR